MEDRHFKEIEKKYGNVTSWAIWQKAGNKPKSNLSKMNNYPRKILEDKSPLKTLIDELGDSFKIPAFLEILI